MQKQKKFLLIRWFIIVLVLLTGGFILVKWLIGLIDPFYQTKRYLSLASQMNQLTEEKISEYNPKSQLAIDVLHYQINIDLRPNQRKIFGDVTITMKINDKHADKFAINFYDNMTIKELQLNGKKAEYTRSEKMLDVKNTDRNVDTANVRIVYDGTPQSLGFGSFNFEKVDDHIEINTLSEPIFASTWLPCIDRPDDKALMDIYITNDTSNVSVSNGKLIDIKSNKTRRTYHWKTFYPISTYLIAIYSGNYKSYSEKYKSITGDTLNLVYYALQNNIENAKKDFSDHRNYIKTFEELFGPYPFVKEKYGIAEFWWQSGAMESQTITGIGSNFISGKKFFSDMLIHELAHHWWGDAVGPKTWKDIWLNEGFATYSEALYWEKQSDIRALQTTLRSKFGMFSDGTLYNPGNSLFGSLVYNKGAWVLHMLRKEVGNKIFFQILREYLKTYEYGNASTNDFKNICEKISKRNLNTFFNQWVYKGVGIIELECNWSVEQKESNFTAQIKIKQLQKGYDIYKFPLDIKLVYDKDEDFTVSTVYVTSKDSVFNISTKKKPTQVIFDPDRWMLTKINVVNENK